MNKHELAKKLREKYDSARLPGNMDFKVEGSKLIMLMQSCGMGLGGNPKNMQDDSAAFEGWALVLKSLLGFDEVLLDTKEDLDCPRIKDELHYNRFLFRALRFSEYYSGWFHLSERIRGRANDFASTFGRKNGFLYNNLAMQTANETMRNKELPFCIYDTDQETIIKENQLEGWLAESAWNAPGCLYRQLPVGIFQSVGKTPEEGGKTYEPESKLAVFSGRGSAVDLWTIADDTMYIYELKNADNKKVGALSELFFYACICFELFCNSNGAIEFRANKPRANMKESITRGYTLANNKGLYDKAAERSIKQISAQLLVPGRVENPVEFLHPALKKEVFMLMEECGETRIRFDIPLFFDEDANLQSVF